MGGGTASAIARAIGAGDRPRAATLAIHAFVIGIGIGVIFTTLLLIFGEQLLTWMGGRGAVLTEALAFSQIYFSGVVLIWLMNTLVAILRGTGNMVLPSVIMFTSAACQIVLGGILSLGLFGVPQLGIRGIAIGQLSGVAIGVLVMGWYVLSGRTGISLRVPGFYFHREMFAEILKVGALSCLYPVQSVLTTSVLTSMLARFGPEVLAGYGIGARLEFFLTSIAFSCGVASMPMVGMAVGAGKIARARRVAWTGAAISAIGVGALVAPLAVFPNILDGPVHRRSAGPQGGWRISSGRRPDVRGAQHRHLALLRIAGCGEGTGLRARPDRAPVRGAVRRPLALEHRRELHLVFRAGRRGNGRFRAVHRGDGSRNLLGHGAARRQQVIRTTNAIQRCCMARFAEPSNSPRTRT